MGKSSLVEIFQSEVELVYCHCHQWSPQIAAQYQLPEASVVIRTSHNRGSKGMKEHLFHWDMKHSHHMISAWADEESRIKWFRHLGIRERSIRWRMNGQPGRTIDAACCSSPIKDNRLPAGFPVSPLG